MEIAPLRTPITVMGVAHTLGQCSLLSIDDITPAFTLVNTKRQTIFFLSFLVIPQFSKFITQLIQFRNDANHQQ